MSPDLLERVIVYGVSLSLGANLLYLYFIDPIKKDRRLYGGHHNWRMLWFSLMWVVVVIGGLYSLGRIYQDVQDICKTDSLLADMLIVSNNEEQIGVFALLWGIICQFADPGNLPLAKGTWAHLFALLAAFAGVVFLSGFIVSSFVNAISKKAKQWRKGEIQYKRIKNYVIVIGSNEQAATIIKEALKKETVNYVLVQTRKDVEIARQQLWLKLDENEEKRVVFYSGERTSREDIKALHVEKAVEIYILGEEMGYENEQDHDAFNINCLELISDYVRNISDEKNQKHKDKAHKSHINRDKLKCFVALEYQSTYTIFKSTQIYSTLDEHVEFIPFNVQEIWAKKVLVDNYAVVPTGSAGESKVFRYLPLDGEDGIAYDSPKTVHLIVLGMNQMGTALAMQAAMLAHYPNFEYDKAVKRRTTITFIDEQAVKESEFFMGRFSAMFDLARHRVVNSPEEILRTEWIDPMEKGRYKYLGENFMDVQWEFIQGNVASPAIQKYMTSIAMDVNAKLSTIAVCFNDPQRAIAAAVYLPEKLLKNVNQVLVYQQNSFDMITKVSTGEKQWKRFNKLRPFGMIEGCYKDKEFGNEVAKLAFYMYKERRLPEVNDYEIMRLDQWWGELGILEKMFNLDLSDAFESKKRSMRDFDTVVSDERVLLYYKYAEHNRWLTEKLTFGFRPLDEEEALEMARISDPEERKRKKRQFISKYRAHLDICSNERIEQVDPKTRANEDMILRNINAMLDLNYQIIIRRSYQAIPQSLYRKRTRRVNDIQAFVHGGMAEINTGNDHFWIGKTPVTQRQWERIMGVNSNKSGHVLKTGKNLYPVENVSWDDTQDFICILNDRTGLNFRLPTVDEWVTAAMGKPLHGADKPYCSEDKDNPKSETGLIGTYKNEYGLLDILGNVWEWTETQYCPPSSQGVCSEPGEANKRKNEETKSYMICGGSWRFGPQSSSRPRHQSGSEGIAWIRSFKSPDLGFRLLLPLHHTIDTNPLDINMYRQANDRIVHEMSYDEKEFKRYHPKASSNDSNLVTVYKRSEKDGILVPFFKIGRTPVTQLQWKAVMGDNNNPSYFKGDDLPVENVSYKDIQDFLSKLNGRFRLPKIEEWEYVARGGSNLQNYPYAGSKTSEAVAWSYEIARNTHAVKTKKPVNIGPNLNADGHIDHAYDIYDMCGNVWEWCEDWHDAEEKTTHVMKGGSWKYEHEYCRIESEMSWIEEYKSNDLGFRLVMDIDE